MATAGVKGLSVIVAKIIQGHQEWKTTFIQKFFIVLTNDKKAALSQGNHTMPRIRLSLFTTY